MKILVTGFDPFGGESVNPSFEAVKLLPDKIGTAEIIKLQIPTSYARGVSAVKAAIEKYEPDIVISVGQAGGRSCVTVEKVAINYADADIADNDGAQPRGKTLAPDGPDAYFVTVPARSMIENVRAHGFECKMSYSAGAYVCNCVMYNTLCYVKSCGLKTLVGFVHVPYSDEQLAGRGGAYPSMPLADIASALRYAVEAAAEYVAAGSGCIDTAKNT